MTDLTCDPVQHNLYGVCEECYKYYPCCEHCPVMSPTCQDLGVADMHTVPCPVCEKEKRNAQA